MKRREKSLLSSFETKQKIEGWASVTMVHRYSYAYNLNLHSMQLEIPWRPTESVLDSVTPQAPRYSKFSMEIKRAELSPESESILNVYHGFNGASI